MKVDEDKFELVDSDSEDSESETNEEASEIENDGNNEEEKQYYTLCSSISAEYKRNKNIDKMQAELNKENEQILSPFVFEGDEYDMCEVSMEQKDGWKAISNFYPNRFRGERFSGSTRNVP